MNFTTKDGKRLCSMVCHQEELLNKKRRWLQGPVTISSSKESKRPKFLANMFLAESHVRSDEVSAESIRTNIEKSFGSFNDSQGKHHVVQDYLQLLDIHNLGSNANDLSNFLKNFYSIMDLLNNCGLYLVASLVTDKKVKFEKIRPGMKEIIKDYLPKVLVESNYKNCLTPLKQLSQIFKDPSNFRDRQMTLCTPVLSPLLSSINNTLKGLDEMPLLDLVAMNRKLRGEMVVPQFPPIIIGRQRDLLIKRVRKRCQNFLLTLKEGADMPEPFAKALSVMRLSLKQKTRCVDISTSEFYPFSPKTVCIQNDILKALWSLPNFRIFELKVLHPLVDPEGKVSMRSFRNSLRTYLMEHLFECDVIELSDEVLSVLACLNKRSRRRPILFSSAMINEEVEGVLNVSCLLKQVVSNLVPDNTTDERSEPLGYNADSEKNSFELDEADYCFTSEEHKHMYSSFLNEGVGTTGDSWTSADHAPIIDKSLLQVPDTCEVGGFIKKSKLEREDSTQTIKNQSDSPHHPETCIDDVILSKCKLEQGDVQSKHTIPVIEHLRESSIQEICDETSLVAYRLIGRMLDKFLQKEGRDVDEMSRFYLLSGSSPSHSQGAEGLNAPDEDVGAEILIETVEELLPSLPKSCIKRAKKLMGYPKLEEHDSVIHDIPGIYCSSMSR